MSRVINYIFISIYKKGQLKKEDFPNFYNVLIFEMAIGLVKMVTRKNF